MLLTPAIPPSVRSYVADNYGGALSNARYETGATCQVCFTPISGGWTRCYPCNEHSRVDGIADHVGAIIYAVSNEQSHHLMRTYKGTPAVEESRQVIFFLLWGALLEHTPCLESLSGRTVTHWSSVPSLPASPGPHPLHVLLTPIAGSPELPLLAASAPLTDSARDLSAKHYRPDTAVAADSHVLIVDDTWTRGGHAQSAALAARAAGAGCVSILNVARYLNRNWRDTDSYLRSHPRADFNPDLCPWTGGTCPATR